MQECFWHCCNLIEDTELTQQEANVISAQELNSCSSSMWTHSAMSVYYAETCLQYKQKREELQGTRLLSPVFGPGRNNG